MNGLTVFRARVAFLLLFLGSGFFFAAPARAVDGSLDDLLNLDIESLASFEVSVASKKAEKISDAPSIVSVISAEDIRRFGANNLRDLLNRHTSIQVYGSSFVPENVVSIRAQSLQHENNHVLFLINGRPMRDGLTGGAIAPFLAGFPLNLIHSIEIIRGPGSVLYGSSAFSGVVNIKTKDEADLEKAMVSIGYGSFNSRIFDATGGTGGDDWSVVGGLKSFRSDGWTKTLFDGAGTAGSFDTDDKDYGAVFSGSYNDIDFNFFAGRAQDANLAPGTNFPSERDYMKNIFADIGYSAELFENWQINFNATYNTLDFGVETASVLRSEDILLETSVRGQLLDNLDFLFGTTFENHDSMLQAGINPSVQWYSAYGQFEYRPVSWLKLVAGTQLNKPKDLKKDFSPRYAAVLNFNENWGAKFLYAEAFRAPYFLETSVTGAVINGNPDLTPEKIETSEAQLFYQGHDYSASLTYYHSQMSDLITRVGFPIQFSNLREIEFDGLEFEGKANLGENVSIMGSVSYQKNEDNLGVKDTTFVPNFMVKAGVSYDSPSGFTIGVFDSFFADPTQVRDVQPVVERNPAPEKHHLVTLNLSLDVNRFVEIPNLPDTEFNLFVDNALDEDIDFPDINTGAINGIPVHSGRAIYGRLTMRF